MKDVSSKKRNKVFLGALIGAGVSLVGGAVSNIMNKNAAKKQQRYNQMIQNRQDTYEQAQNLTAGYGNQEYVDDLMNNVNFKLGGRRRKKCEDGAKFDWTPVISGATNAINSIGTAATNASIDRTNRVNSQSFMANVPKTEVVLPDYVVNGEYMDRQLPMFKCGGKRRR